MHLHWNNNFSPKNNGKWWVSLITTCWCWNWHIKILQQQGSPRLLWHVLVAYREWKKNSFQKLVLELCQCVLTILLTFLSTLKNWLKIVLIIPYHPLSFSPSFLAICHLFPSSSSYFIVVFVIPCHPSPSFIAYHIVPHHPPITPNVAHCTPLKGIPISIWHMVG
jgi:hypothetical protein